MYIEGGLMYINMLLDNRNGFSNITKQIQNLTMDVTSAKSEILEKIEVTIDNHPII